MALFDKKPKKLSLDEILKGIENLSEEEKAQVKTKMEDVYKAEDEREIDKIEEDKASDTETKDEKGEEVSEESEEIGKDVDEVEDEVETDEAEKPEEKQEESEETEPQTETEETVEETAKETTKHNDESKAWMQSVTQTLEEIKQVLKGFTRESKQVEDKEADKLEALARKFE